MENDLISRSGLSEDISTLTMTITGLCAGKGVLREFMIAYRQIVLRIIDEAPTVDAVEVVRCKDCKFYETGVEYYGGGTKDVCRFLKRQMVDEDFCSYGERRADDD